MRSAGAARMGCAARAQVHAAARRTKVGAVAVLEALGAACDLIAAAAGAGVVGRPVADLGRRVQWGERQQRMRPGMYHGACRGTRQPRACSLHGLRAGLHGCARLPCSPCKWAGGGMQGRGTRVRAPQRCPSRCRRWRPGSSIGSSAGGRAGSRRAHDGWPGALALARMLRALNARAANLGTPRCAPRHPSPRRGLSRDPLGVCARGVVGSSVRCIASAAATRGRTRAAPRANSSRAAAAASGAPWPP